MPHLKTYINENYKISIYREANYGELFDLENDPNEINNLFRVKEFQDIKNDLVSKLLSHRMIHQERQLSNTKLSSSGVKTNFGPFSRKMDN